ncbi:MAG: hypothetical protein WAW88_01935, partial [Nocardioides sp.]
MTGCNTRRHRTKVGALLIALTTLGALMSGCSATKPAQAKPPFPLPSGTTELPAAEQAAPPVAPTDRQRVQARVIVDQVGGRSNAVRRRAEGAVAYLDGDRVVVHYAATPTKPELNVSITRMPFLADGPCWQSERPGDCLELADEQIHWDSDRIEVSLARDKVWLTAGMEAPRPETAEEPSAVPDPAVVATLDAIVRDPRLWQPPQAAPASPHHTGWNDDPLCQRSRAKKASPSPATGTRAATSSAHLAGALVSFLPVASTYTPTSPFPQVTAFLDSSDHEAVTLSLSPNRLAPACSASTPCHRVGDVTITWVLDVPPDESARV